MTDTPLSAYYIRPKNPPIGTAMEFNTYDWMEHQ